MRFRATRYIVTEPFQSKCGDAELHDDSRVRELAVHRDLWREGADA